MKKSAWAVPVWVLRRYCAITKKAQVLKRLCCVIQPFLWNRSMQQSPTTWQIAKRSIDILSRLDIARRKVGASSKDSRRSSWWPYVRVWLSNGGHYIVRKRKRLPRQVHEAT